VPQAELRRKKKVAARDHWRIYVRIKFGLLDLDFFYKLSTTLVRHSLTENRGIFLPTKGQASAKFTKNAMMAQTYFSIKFD
jgi:hypothetical protein